MTQRIQRLKQELERLEDAAETCHPGVHAELRSLIEDVRTHLSELEHAADLIEKEHL